MNQLIDQLNLLEQQMRQSKSAYERDSYLDEIQLHIDHITRIQIDLNNLPKYTKKELGNFDGKEGRKAYISVRGYVYDVTNERTWMDSTHYGLEPGKDLTSEFYNCHNQERILQGLPIVGTLIDE